MDWTSDSNRAEVASMNSGSKRQRTREQLAEENEQLRARLAEAEQTLEAIRSGEVDALVVASPIFFMGVTAQLKAVIDRCQCFWIERFVLERRPYEGKRHPKGLFVATAGSQKPEVFSPAIHCVKALFIALDYSYAGEILLPNTDASDIAERRKPVLLRAREAGKKLVG